MGNVLTLRLWYHLPHTSTCRLSSSTPRRSDRPMASQAPREVAASGAVLQGRLQNHGERKSRGRVLRPSKWNRLLEKTYSRAAVPKRCRSKVLLAKKAVFSSFFSSSRIPDFRHRDVVAHISSLLEALYAVVTIAFNKTVDAEVVSLAYCPCAPMTSVSYLCVPSTRFSQPVHPASHHPRRRCEVCSEGPCDCHLALNHKQSDAVNALILDNLSPMLTVSVSEFQSSLASLINCTRSVSLASSRLMVCVLLI